MKAGIGGGVISQGEVETAVERARSLASEWGVEILLMDADVVFGKVHIETAIEHADRAFERGKNVADARMMEVMLYASGERQLSSAIQKMGIRETTRRVAVAVSVASRLDDVIEKLGVTRDDTVLEGGAKDLRRFGINVKSVKSVGKGRGYELVLEKVALVDLTK